MSKSNYFIILLLFLSVGCTMNEKTKLESQINEMFNSVNGDFALAFKLLDKNQESILINADEMFHAASTMKTPVMIEAYRQDAESKINLEDSIVVKNSFKSIVDGSTYSMDIGRDSGDKMYDRIGKKATYYELVYDMIINSSNLATNIVIEQIDAKNVMKTMDQLGAKTIKVLRGVEDMKAFDLGMNNETSANDLMVIYEHIVKGTAVSPASDSNMIKILLDQRHKSIIPKKLPKDIKVAHKTGSITGVFHDSGVVFLPDGRKYVLVILSKNVKSPEKAKEMMSDISKMLYEYLVKSD